MEKIPTQRELVIEINFQFNLPRTGSKTPCGKPLEYQFQHFPSGTDNPIPDSISASRTAAFFQKHRGLWESQVYHLLSQPASSAHLY